MSDTEAPQDHLWSSDHLAARGQGAGRLLDEGGEQAFTDDEAELGSEADPDEATALERDTENPETD